MPTLDEDLLDQAGEPEAEQLSDEERANAEYEAELARYNQQLRLQQQNQKRNSAIQQAKNAALSQAKGYAKKAARQAIWEFLAATWEIWAPILGILLVIGMIIGLFMFVSVTMISYCNQGGAAGWSAWLVSKGSGLTGTGDFCKALAINTQTATTAAPPIPAPAPLGKLTDAQARSQLAGFSIIVNKPQPATSLEGITLGVINEIILFSSACSKSVAPNSPETSNKCNVVFTGGTETTGGHAGGPCSHLSGNKADIGANQLIDNFIAKTFQRINNRGSDGALQYVSNITSIVYARESDHWDIGGVGC